MQKGVPANPNRSYTSAEHQRMGAMVLRKIEHVYHVGASDYTLSPSQQNKIDQKLQDFIVSEEWDEACDKQIRFAKLDNVGGKKLKEALTKSAKTILREYVHGLSVRAAIVATPEDTIHENYRAWYAPLHNRESMGDAYINHISNTAQKNLQAIGLNEQGNLSIHGKLIVEALKLYNVIDPNASRYVDPNDEPKIEPMNAGIYDSPKDQMQEIEDYWRTRRDKLTEQVRLR